MTNSSTRVYLRREKRIVGKRALGGFRFENELTVTQRRGGNLFATGEGKKKGNS